MPWAPATLIMYEAAEGIAFFFAGFFDFREFVILKIALVSGDSKKIED